MAKIEKQIVYNVLMALAFLVLVLELFHLQVYEHHKYFQYSEKNRIRRLVLQPTRGLIYDQNGNVLVDNQPSYTLYAVPYECSKNDSAIALLAKILKSSQSEI
ncbi:MAG: penicillin-binding protein 2, partial [Actinobacteria bacterium]|nr:penicillin-binding protein 2 [Actinomycetota bacterium]